MTRTTSINAMTGLKFSATLVTAAITAAGEIISGFVDDTFAEGNDEALDSAVTLMAADILVQGKNIRNLGANTSQYEVKKLFTPEINKLLATYLEASQTFYVSIAPEDRITDTTTHWRE